MNCKKVNFESNYFDLFEISDSIYAAMSKKDSGSNVSSGFFNLGNYIIIFDTHIYPGAARDLYNAVKELYGQDPSFIINSHFHSDHLLGNCLFPESIPIISTPITLNKIKEVCFDHLKHFQDTAEEEVKKRNEMLNADNPPFSEQEIYNDLEFYEFVTDPNFKIRLPNFLINDEIIVNGNEKTVHLIPNSSGHTDSDIIAYFPNEKICFMGDLLFADLDDSWAPSETGRFNAVNPQNLYGILESLIKKDIEIYVPGHGDLSTKNEIQMNMNFIKKYYLKE